MPEQDVPIARHFADLPDPRVDRAEKHSLGDVLAVALCAVVCGADSREEVEAFGQARHDWLERFLALPNGIPSRDTFARVFRRLDPKRFGRCVGEWMAGVCEAAGLRHVAVDGKACRSAPRGTLSGCPHLVRACWSVRGPPRTGGSSAGRRWPAGRTSEIAAIPELLRTLDLEGASVGIAAAGCRTEIARQIRDRGGAYILAVKGNRPSVRAAVRAVFGRGGTPTRPGCRTTGTGRSRPGTGGSRGGTRPSPTTPGGSRPSGRTWRPWSRSSGGGR